MRDNQGIALISVLLVTFAIMIIGMGTLMLTNSNLMVSQNLVSHSVARTNSEAGIDAVLVALQAEVVATGRLPGSMPQPSVQLHEGGTVDYRLVREPVWNNNIALIEVEGLGPRNARYISEAVVEFTSEEGTGVGVTPFTGLIQACELVSLSNGGRIDSFDSRAGPYSEHSAGRNADVHILGPNGHVESLGYAPLHGNVYSTGTFLATGSTPIYGDVHTSSDVTVTAAVEGNPFTGNLNAAGNITLTNTFVTLGGLSANGDILIEGWGASSIGGNVTAGGNIAVTGGAVLRQNALAGETISTRSADNILGTRREHGNPPPVAPVPTRDCDPLNLRSYTDRFSGVTTDYSTLKAGWPTRHFQISPSEITHYDLGQNRWTSATQFTPQQAPIFSDQELVSVYRVRDVDFGDTGHIDVIGGNVVLIVDGDLTLSGNSSMTVAPDSSLTVFVLGRTTLTASFKMLNTDVVNSQGVPSFSIMSLVEQSSLQGWQPSGVEISGNGKVAAAIYSPYSNVVFTGSGEVSGAVLGKQVRVTGGGRIHYDEALGEATYGNGGAAEDGAVAVRLVSRR